MKPIQIELPTFFEAMTVNTWLFIDPEPTLIDCGEKTEKSWTALEKGLQKYGLKIGDIKRVIITHAHLDHIGMAGKIAENSDAKVWVNEYVYPWTQELKKHLDLRSQAILSAMKPNLPEEWFKKFTEFGYKMLHPFWDEIPKEKVEIFPMSGQLSIGGSNWEIVHTPGHCLNQTCFFNPENGYFLSADMLMRMIPSPIIDAELSPPHKRVKSLVMQMKSYHKIAQLNISTTFPGHLAAFEDANELIRKQIQKVEVRKNKCLELIQKGVNKVIDIIQYIYPGRVNDATIFMVIGLLDILKEEDKIEQIEENGKYYYVEKIYSA